jgi:two-component sensor histidine kinase/PAS domain-containing protein
MNLIMTVKRLRPSWGLGAAILLAVAAQLARIPLDPPALIPFITYVPFILLGAFLGGMAPGLLTTCLCVLESLYFAAGQRHLLGAAALALTGVTASVLFERLRRFEDRLHAANAELSTIQANSPVALLLVDEQIHVQKANGAAARLASRSAMDLQGLYPGAALGCSNARKDPEGCGRGPSCTPCALRQAALDTLRNRVSHRGIEAWVPAQSAGGPESRYLLIYTAPVELDGAKALICVQDITERKQGEESMQELLRELEKALLEKTVLLKEIHHRVKNNLAVISSLLSMRADATETLEVRLALEDSQQRVRSIALIHEHLYGSEHLDRIDFGAYAHQLVQDLHAAFAPDPPRISVQVQAAPIAVGVHRAVPCALILNELLMNVFKHAFPAGRAGRVCVSFGECQPGVLELAVEDNGVGCAGSVARCGRQSLGLRIVDILAKQLDGTMHREAVSGTRVVLRFAEHRG